MRVVLLCQAFTDFAAITQVERQASKHILQITEIVDHGDQVQSAVKQIILDRIQVTAMEITSRTP
ncbi:unnamed protein product, partial [Musa textilis]